MPNRHNGPDPEPSGRARQALLRQICPEGSLCAVPDCKAPSRVIRFDMPRWHPLGPSMDHILPRSLGGTWDPANLRPAHYGCNSSRQNKLDTPEPMRRSRRW